VEDSGRGLPRLHRRRRQGQRLLCEVRTLSPRLPDSLPACLPARLPTCLPACLPARLPTRFAEMDRASQTQVVGLNHCDAREQMSASGISRRCRKRPVVESGSAHERWLSCEAEVSDSSSPHPGHCADSQIGPRCARSRLSRVARRDYTRRIREASANSRPRERERSAVACAVSFTINK
jgi:hypothetical protein